MKKILLMGNPNVGKSAVFSRLTGARVISSNYPGTTVEFTEGAMDVEGKKTLLIDVPVHTIWERPLRQKKLPSICLRTEMWS